MERWEHKSILITNDKSTITRIFYRHERTVKTQFRIRVVKSIWEKVKEINEIYEADPTNLEPIKEIASSLYDAFDIVVPIPQPNYMEAILSASLGILDSSNPIHYDGYEDGVRALMEGLRAGKPNKK